MKIKGGFLAVVAILAIFILTPFLASIVSSQSQGDFKILNWNWSVNEIDYIVVNGEVKNVGLVAAGVELQIIIRNESGHVVYSAEFWPASIKNIRPGDTWPIRYIHPAMPGATKASMRVIGSRTW